MVKVAAPTAAAGRTLPSYKKPPVTEVVVGVHFDAPLPEFGVQHTGLFWHRVRDRFPHSQQAAPVAVAGGDLRWLDGTTGLPLPRVWLISETKNDLIQLQGDCFFFNWRKQADTDTYPRYKRIIANFDQELAAFLSFLREFGFEEPKPMLCELTYVNHIPRGEAWKTIDDVTTIFKDFRWSKDKELFPIPKTLSWSCSFDLTDNAGTLTARLRQVTRLQPPSEALRLEMICKGLGEAKSVRDITKWFDIAHEWIVRGFSDLTTREAQKRLWEREDV